MLFRSETNIKNDSTVLRERVVRLAAKLEDVDKRLDSIQSIRATYVPKSFFLY